MLGMSNVIRCNHQTSRNVGLISGHQIKEIVIMVLTETEILPMGQFVALAGIHSFISFTFNST